MNLNSQFLNFKLILKHTSLSTSMMWMWTRLQWYRCISRIRCWSMDTSLTCASMSASQAMNHWESTCIRRDWQGLHQKRTPRRSTSRISSCTWRTTRSIRRMISSLRMRRVSRMISGTSGLWVPFVNILSRWALIWICCGRGFMMSSSKHSFVVNRTFRLTWRSTVATEQIVMSCMVSTSWLTQIWSPG